MLKIGEKKGKKMDGLVQEVQSTRRKRRISLRENRQKNIKGVIQFLGYSKACIFKLKIYQVSKCNG